MGSEQLTLTMEFASGEAYVALLQDIAAPISAMLADKPAELREGVWRAIADAAGQYATADGTVVMENQTVLVAGRA